METTDQEPDIWTPEARNWPELGQTVKLVRDHAWHGHYGQVIGWRPMAMGRAPRVRLENGHETLITDGRWWEPVSEGENGQEPQTG